MQKSASILAIFLVLASCTNRQDSRQGGSTASQTASDHVKAASNPSQADSNISQAGSTREQTASNPSQATSDPASENPLMAYWDIQRKGANQFNKYPSLHWFETAAEAHIEVVRLTYGKWESDERDFLLGNADHYRGIVEADFRTLLQSLHWADSLGLKVVLTPLSLPGARWRQNNNGVEDERLWKDPKYLDQAKQFWKDLAQKLDHHPAIVGFTPKNEPHPEHFFGIEDFEGPEFERWYDSVRGTVADINHYNRELVAAIRSVDKTTPIILESGHWASAKTYTYLEPVDDPYVLYAFHNYEPWGFTTFRINQGKYGYPGMVSPGPWSDALFMLDKAWLEGHFETVAAWSERHNVPSNRIFVSEFGCSRKIEGVKQYFADQLEIFNSHGWHWAFYSYREDVWDQMDYELGADMAGTAYWEVAGMPEFHAHYEEIYGGKEDNPIWKVLSEALAFSFDTEKWQAKEGKDYIHREEMYKQVLYSDVVRRMTRSEVLEQLGPPDRQNENVLYYTVSQKKIGSWPLHTRTLVIKFDINNAVAWIKLHE